VVPDAVRDLPHGVIHYGADGSIIDVNPAASQMPGVDPAGLTSWPEAALVGAARQDDICLLTARLTGPVSA
jgi:PAS domain-containing protein